jgi:hypothetical protein
VRECRVGGSAGRRHRWRGVRPGSAAGCAKPAIRSRAGERSREGAAGAHNAASTAMDGVPARAGRPGSAASSMRPPPGWSSHSGRLAAHWLKLCSADCVGYTPDPGQAAGAAAAAPTRSKPRPPRTAAGQPALQQQQQHTYHSRHAHIVSDPPHTTNQGAAQPAQELASLAPHRAPSASFPAPTSRWDCEQQLTACPPRTAAAALTAAAPPRSTPTAGSSAGAHSQQRQVLRQRRRARRRAAAGAPRRGPRALCLNDADLQRWAI